jgi:LPS export ABC transporter protein LptC
MEARTMASVGILLVTALGSTALLLRAREKPLAQEASPQLGIGYYLTDAMLSGTGDDGRILYRVRASTVVQTPGDGSVNMENVSVDYEPATQIPWSLRADTGKMLPGGKIMRLSGNVVAATRDADRPPATISTDYLEFDPDTDTATTTSKVVIRYADSIVEGTGLRAMLREDRMELLADVQGQYVR